MPRNFRALSFTLLVAAIYLAVATGGFRQANRGEMTEGRRYEQLARAFLHGRTWLGQASDGVFFTWDLSPYQGRYYLYFGAVPALLYYVPLALVTNGPIPSFPLVFAFCFGVFLLEMSLLRRFLPGIDPATQAAAAFLLAFGNGSLVELNRPIYYQEAITGAMFFFFLGIWTFIRHFEKGRARYLAFSGASFALAAGCRPLVLVPEAVFLAFAVWPLWRTRPRLLAIQYAPLLLGLALLGAYNYARFGNALEFGLRYQKAVLEGIPLEFLSLPRMFATLPYRLALPPDFVARFPFLVAKPAMGPYMISTYLFWQEHPLGLFFLAPTLVFFVSLIYRTKAAIERALPFSGGEAGAIFFLCGAASFLVVAATPWFVDRYDFETLPLFALASLFAWSRWRAENPRIASALLVGGVAAACFVNSFVAIG